MLVNWVRALARTTWILPRQSLLSSIAVRSSPIVANLVSSSKVCMYIQVKIQSSVANASPDSKIRFNNFDVGEVYTSGCLVSAVGSASVS